MKFKQNTLLWGLVLCAVLSCCEGQEGATEGNPLAEGDKKGRNGDPGATFYTQKSNPFGCPFMQCGYPGESNQWDIKARQCFDIHQNSQGRKKRSTKVELCPSEDVKIWWVKFLWPVHGVNQVMWAYVWSHIPWTKCVKNQRNYCDDNNVYINGYKTCCKEDMKIMPIIVIMHTPQGHPLRPQNPKCFWQGTFPAREYCFVRLWVRYPACCSCKRCNDNVAQCL